MKFNKSRQKDTKEDIFHIKWKNFIYLYLIIIQTTFFIALLSLLSFFAYSSKEFQLDASSDTLIIEQDEDLKKYRKVIEIMEQVTF